MDKDQELPKFFNFREAEQRIYSFWDKQGVFRAEPDPTKKPFCLVIPPPNVTGILHMGHVLDNVPQDVMTRWHRMRGFAAVWIPGTDHAGIATQNVVKRQLDREGINYRELGREKFVERVWAWKAKHGSIIIEQLKRLGCSCNWERERFTMDAQLSRAVVAAFIDYYNKGLIYKGKRMINWCTVCATALANDEVEHQEKNSHLWHFRYPVIDDDCNPTSENLVVATTRPETMLGDTAVAVHPEDERYLHLHDKYVLLPLQNRRIPVICDSFVDRQFGTGVVKVTPGHDPNDYRVGVAHNLPIEVVIGEDGRMTTAAGLAYAGKDRFEARKQVVNDLEALGYLEQIQSYRHSVGECYRCNSVVEPLISSQWFVRMTPLAEKAKAAVLEGRITIIPESEKHDYFHWMETIQDWCISRQLWWGHRIPVYYCQKCNHQMARAELPKVCENCGCEQLKQDEDVLDTWFSSQLWPFSTLGWPEKTAELSYWYPNNWLMSGRDILFFWDARMIMAGLELMGDVPFRTLALHGLVRDDKGRKLSKSLGNSPDPLLLFEEYGADAVRASISMRYPMGRQDSRLTADFYKVGQGLVTKLWNSSRFLLLNLQGTSLPSLDVLKDEFLVEDRWILSALRECISRHDAFLEKSDLVHAFQALYSFFWEDFCDWYIEIIKPRLRDGGPVSLVPLTVALEVTRNLLKLFHPYLPFITEELWQLFRSQGAVCGVVDECSVTQTLEANEEVLALAKWPDIARLEQDITAEQSMSVCISFIRGIRDVRSTLQIPPKVSLRAKAVVAEWEEEEMLRIVEPMVKALGYLEELKIVNNKTSQDSPSEDVSSYNSMSIAEDVPFPFTGGVGYLALPQDINKTELKRTLDNKISKLSKALGGAESRLNNPSFAENAPLDLVADTEALVAEYRQTIVKLRGYVSSLS